MKFPSWIVAAILRTGGIEFRFALQSNKIVRETEWKRENGIVRETEVETRTYVQCLEVEVRTHWRLKLKYAPAVDHEERVVAIQYVSGEVGAVYVLSYQVLQLKWTVTSSN